MINHQSRAMPIHYRYLPNPAGALGNQEPMVLVNHELRTALCIVLMATEALQYELLGPLTTAQREALAKINENAIYLRALMESMSQFLYQEQNRPPIS